MLKGHIYVNQNDYLSLNIFFFFFRSTFNHRHKIQENWHGLKCQVCQCVSAPGKILHKQFWHQSIKHLPTWPSTNHSLKLYWQTMSTTVLIIIHTTTAKLQEGTPCAIPSTNALTSLNKRPTWTKTCIYSGPWGSKLINISLVGFWPSGPQFIATNDEMISRKCNKICKTQYCNNLKL